MKLPDGDFILYMRDSVGSTKKTDTLSAKSTYWYINYNGVVKRGISNILKPYEQLFPDWGISVDITQCIMPGNTTDLDDQSNGFITSSVKWSNISQQWLSNVVDDDPIYTNVQYQGGTLAPQFNWIRSGNSGTPDFTNPEINDFAIAKVPLDPRKAYAKNY